MRSGAAAQPSFLGHVSVSRSGRSLLDAACLDEEVVLELRQLVDLVAHRLGAVHALGVHGGAGLGILRHDLGVVEGGIERGLQPRLAIGGRTFRHGRIAPRQPDDVAGAERLVEGRDVLEGTGRARCWPGRSP